MVRHDPGRLALPTSEYELQLGTLDFEAHRLTNGMANICSSNGAEKFCEKLRFYYMDSENEKCNKDVITILEQIVKRP